MRGMLLICLAFWPFWAAAAPVPVQSGEHAGFSRIVLLFGDVPDWRFGRVAGGFELRPGRSGASYDLARVFDFIPRTRVAGTEARPGGRLFLAVTCDCHADVFEIRTGLVIDIKDGPAPRNARFEGTLDPVADPAAPAASAPMATLRPTPRPGPPFPVSILTPERLFDARPWRTDLAWANELAVDVGGGTRAADAAASEAPGPAQALVEVAQAQLVAEIARAAAQGLVTADTRPAGAIGHDANPSQTAPPAAAAEGATSGDTGSHAGHPAPAANFRAVTAMDATTVEASEPEPFTSDGAPCLPPQLVDIAAWAAPPDKGISLGPFRSALVRDLDGIDAASVRDFARAYIYLTFGAEARALLSALGADVEARDVLLGMADIMDQGGGGGPGVFRDQIACESNVALWAVLARPTISAGDPVAKEAALSAFAELPLHLRRHLGPGLAQRFLGIGDTGTAATIRNMIARAPGDHGAGFRMMEAEIALETGKPDTAAEDLAELVAGDGDLAGPALIRLIDTRLDAGGAVTEDQAATAAALAFEHRGTPLGGELRRVELRALAHLGRYVAASKATRMAAEREELPQDIASTLQREILGLAAEDANDALFLQLVLPGPTDLGPDPAADTTRQAVAARLVALGMTNAARDVLSSDTAVPDAADRRLYAEALMRERRPDLALGYLAGLKDAKAELLRARALEMTDAHKQAAETYAQLGDADSRAGALWRSQDWGQPEDLRQPERVAAARLLAAPADPASGVAAATTESGVLARDRALLEHSRTARETLAALLAETVVP